MKYFVVLIVIFLSSFALFSDDFEKMKKEWLYESLESSYSESDKRIIFDFLLQDDCGKIRYLDSIIRNDRATLKIPEEEYDSIRYSKAFIESLERYINDKDFEPDPSDFQTYFIHVYSNDTTFEYVCWYAPDLDSIIGIKAPAFDCNPCYQFMADILGGITGIPTNLYWVPRAYFFFFERWEYLDEIKIWSKALGCD